MIFACIIVYGGLFLLCAVFYLIIKWTGWGEPLYGKIFEGDK